MQAIAPELGQVVLPKALPAGENELFELAVGGDQDLSGAGLEPDQVGAVLGHGTGTVHNDIGEITAFEDRGAYVYIASDCARY